MKKFLVVFTVLAVLSASVVAQAAWTPTYQKVEFDQLLVGGMSYNADTNIDVAADELGAFRMARASVGSPTSLQKIGGDGDDDTVSGNFAMFLGVHYNDPLNILGWAASNPNTPFAMEVRAWGVDLDTNLDLEGFDGEKDWGESLTLNALDMPGLDYLTATFAELAAWGNTDVTQGQGDSRVWMDITVDSVNQKVALSVVISNFAHAGWPDMEAFALPGTLQGYTPNVTPGSGFYVGAVPEPATLLIWSVLGVLGIAVTWWRRR